jgi:hypothetical protein
MLKKKGNDEAEVCIYFVLNFFRTYRHPFELLFHSSVLAKYTFNTWMPILELEI